MDIGGRRSNAFTDNLFNYGISMVYKKRSATLGNCRFFGAFTGFALLILALGNYARAEIVVNSTEQRGLLAELLFRVARETYYMLIHMWPRFLVLLVLFLFLKKRKYSVDKLRILC